MLQSLHLETLQTSRGNTGLDRSDYQANDNVVSPLEIPASRERAFAMLRATGAPSRTLSGPRHAHIGVEMGDDGEEYKLVECAHDPDELFNSPSALRIWNEWMPTWQSSVRSCYNPAGLYTAMHLFGEMSFFGTLGPDKVEIELDADLCARTGDAIGLCTPTVRKRDSVVKRIALIEIDHNDYHSATGNEDYRSLLLSDLIHEALHAFRSLYACNGTNCASSECKQKQRETVGCSAHGKAWLEMADAIRVVSRDRMSFRPGLDFCRSNAREYSLSGVVPDSAQFGRISSPAHAAADPAL
ncbi:hypothetical protein BAUCODRAFT_128531 [Baudoinia panamericana UAMH 10762]|uniref:Uncharacterized protein n=1 Tax=Baudoinia panamericana (strain UAMH 10762) TaxID=717646 RepID=M2NKW5_BAUPA|nr:uncharacterized protein BAUCODRAFT_128531 [Baudoinia panamericana UAMH 10762]EMC99785.1 hypothetical protein BAUCODRAFT_128531 [Baudoinia panamericana UAMH 10762]